jgi:hypothetical protein
LLLVAGPRIFSTVQSGRFRLGKDYIEDNDVRRLSGCNFQSFLTIPGGNHFITEENEVLFAAAQHLRLVINHQNLVRHVRP